MKYESDILATGLDVIFCGLNPAASAAAAGHNFSNPSNRFWNVLHLAGFTTVRLRPEEERRLLEFGCGITAVVSRPTRQANEVQADEFRQARSGFEAKMRCYAPRSIAFLGKRSSVGHDRPIEHRLGPPSAGVRRDDRLGSSKSKRSQQELYARGPCNSLLRIATAALLNR